MNTRSKTLTQDEIVARNSSTEEKMPAKDRGNNQEEHEQVTETKMHDAVAELTENLHKISFGEPRDAAANVPSTISTSKELKEQLPAICNEVFRVLGPYNLEATYQRALALELRERDVTVLSEVEIPVEYKGQRIATRRVDLYLRLDKPVILELKAVTAALKTEHIKQLKFYMTHFNVAEGYLINFPHVTGFPDENNEQYVEHALQGADISERVTRSSTPRKDAEPTVIHVQQVTAKANRVTTKKSKTTKTTKPKKV